VGLPILVYQADARPLEFDPDGAEVETGRHQNARAREISVRLCFHRHYLTLGEHYNSVVPAAELGAGGR
jgi:hypothetical protein